MSIARPENLVHAELSLEFNFRNFEVFEIDLKHINKNKRSRFKADEVAFIVKHLIEGVRLFPSEEKAFDQEFCSYFVRRGLFQNKSYKVVFCICSDRPRSIGIITLHRIRG